MKTKLIILMCLLMVSGCAITPGQRLYDSKLVFLGTLRTINVLKDAGRFDADEIREIRAFANAGNEILLDWEEAGGMTPEPVEAFETILKELIRYRLKGESDG